MSFWPNATQRLLLQASLLQGDAALDAWERWQRSIELDEIDSGSQRILPLLYRNLVDQGVDPESLGRVRGVYRRSWVRNHQLRRAAAGAVAALSDADIETIVVKGLRLSEREYPDPAARPMSDVDVFVPLLQFEAAIAVLAQLGWHPKYRAWTPIYRAIGLVDRDGNELDLHYVFAQRGHPSTWDDRCWSERESLMLGGTETSVLSAEDELVYTFAHGLHDNSLPPFRWVADAALLIRRNAIDWDRLVAVARLSDAVLPTRAGLGAVRTLAGADVPIRTTSELGAIRPTLLNHVEYGLAHLKEPRVPPTALVYLHDARFYGRVPTPWGYASFLTQHWGTRDPRRLAGHILRRAVTFSRGRLDLQASVERSDR